MDASTYEQSLRAAGGGYLTRDFVETAEGLLFAVVANGLEEDRVLSSLRYIRAGTDLRKLDTSTANQLLRECHPDYLFRSRRRDVDLHAVSPAQMVRHYRPAAQLAEIVARPRRDPLEEKVRRLSEIIGAGVTPPGWLGVTGSLLVGAHQARSDIDLVTYGRRGFCDRTGASPRCSVRRAHRHSVGRPVARGVRAPQLQFDAGRVSVARTAQVQQVLLRRNQGGHQLRRGGAGVVGIEWREVAPGDHPGHG